MIKVAFKTYFKNIFHFFTILGFVALGALVALSIFIPSMKTLIDESTNTIKASASQFTGFNPQGFAGELVNQIRSLNWTNPLAQVQYLFNQDNFISLLSTALEKGGNISVSQIASIKGTLDNCYTNAVNTISKELIIFITTTMSFAVLGYIVVTIMIHFKTMKNYNIIRFVLSIALNTMFLSFIYYLISLVTIRVQGGLQILSLVGVGLLFLLGLLAISFITYSKKGVKFREVVNFKTAIGLIFADLIIIALSGGIVFGIFQSNKLLAFFIALPLISITTIILENMTDAFIASKNQMIEAKKKA